MNILYMIKIKYSSKYPSTYKLLTCHNCFCLAMITNSIVEGMEPAHNHKNGVKINYGKVKRRVSIGLGVTN